MKERILDLIPDIDEEGKIRGDIKKKDEIIRLHRIRTESDKEPVVTNIAAQGKRVAEDKKEKTVNEGAVEKNTPAEPDPPVERGPDKSGKTEEEAAKEEPEIGKRPPDLHLLKRLTAVFFALLLLVYLAGVVVFSIIFYPQTRINGIACGMKNVQETERLINDAILEYSIVIEGRNGVTASLESSEINLKPVFHGEVKRTLKSQKPFGWVFLIGRPADYNVEEVTIYSKEALRQCVKEMPFFDKENIIEPRDAYIGDITDEGYVIIKEDNGAVPLEGGIVEAVATAVDTLEGRVDIDNNSCYITADITSADRNLNTLVDNLNTYCAAKITYRFGKNEEILDGKQISEWIKVEGTEVSFDESRVAEYVRTLARKYDTFGQPHKFTTHSGEEITVTQGAYGWWIDRVNETAALTEAIKSGYRGERTPVYKAEAAQYDYPDFGDDYVEIDLTSQHLWVYKDGRVVTDSDFVSGNVSKNNGTHVGIYGITYKERNATLSGANYSSHVSYWMPFNGNEGMHDASWRSSFGGEIYLTGGSHGCVNLPLANAAKIYDYVEKGEAVIVYGGKTYTPPVEALPQDPLLLDPVQQLQLLIDAGILNPDGTLPETTTIQE